MKELGGVEEGEGVEGGTEATRVSGASLGELMSREEESPTSSGIKCWQGEVEVEDQWGISSPTPRSEGCAPSDRPSGPLRKSKLRQQYGSTRSFRCAGRRIFSCFRHSSITLMVPGLEPSTPPKSGPLSTPRKSVGGANGVTFLHEAADHVDDDDSDLGADEPTSPVVNCMGQVRPQQKHCKKVKAASTRRERRLGDREKFRRTKSQARSGAPGLALKSKSKSCNWKQLLRSNSSSISPSTHPVCGGSEREPEIDLGRFSSASGCSASQSEKPRDKTCLLMRRNNTTCRSNDPGQESRDNSSNIKQELGARDESDNGGDDEHRKAGAESDPVLRNLPSLNGLQSIESPKWFADERLVNKGQGLWKSSTIDSQIRAKYFERTPVSHI